MEVLHVRHKNYTRSVPTQCPRHMVAETDELSRALDEAAAAWPEMAEREATVRGLAGSMTGTWPADWKKGLRGEWPA